MNGTLRDGALICNRRMRSATAGPERSTASARSLYGRRAFSESNCRSRRSVWSKSHLSRMCSQRCRVRFNM